MAIFCLKRVLREGKVFRVKLIVLYRKKRQLGFLLNLVHREGICLSPNMEGVLWLLGYFSNLF